MRNILRDHIPNSLRDARSFHVELVLDIVRVHPPAESLCRLTPQRPLRTVFLPHPPRWGSPLLASGRAPSSQSHRHEGELSCERISEHTGGGYRREIERRAVPYPSNILTNTCMALPNEACCHTRLWTHGSKRISHPFVGGPPACPMAFAGKGKWGVATHPPLPLLPLGTRDAQIVTSMAPGWRLSHIQPICFIVFACTSVVHA